MKGVRFRCWRIPAEGKRLTVVLSFAQVKADGEFLCTGKLERCVETPETGP